MNFKGIREQISAFRDTLSAFVDTLPDGNDGVKFLDKEKKCATVSLSTIMRSKGSIMSPCYYLNHRAKDELRRIIASTRLECLDTVIERIIESGTIPTSSGRQSVKANPQFIAKIKEMWETKK